MTEETNNEAYWQKKLSVTAYGALRKGEMEPPHTGAYVTTRVAGTYLCAGCGAPLFSSLAKVIDGSGYATFREPLDPGRVTEVTHYSETGESVVGFTCTNCGGHIGDIDTLSLRSALDLEQGTSQRLYHASSNSVVLKKTLSLCNYPVGAGIALLAVGLIGYLGWSWAMSLVNVSELGRSDTSIPLWVGDVEVRANIVRLDQPNASTSGMVVRQDQALLLVLGDRGNVPAIRFANHSVDILWLDDTFHVVGWEHERASQASQALDRPVGAAYALIAQPGAVSAQAFATGYEIIVTDKGALF